MFIHLLIIQVLIFVGLALLLRNILTRNVTGATAHLEQLSQDFEKKQQDAKKRLAEAEQYYQKTLAQAQQEASQLKVRFEQEAQRQKDKVLEQARQESERIIERAGKTRTLLISELEQKIENRAVDRACELIQQVLPNHLHKEMHTHWFEELVSGGLEEIGRLQVPKDITEACVISAFGLSAQQQELLRKKLQEKLKRNIKLKEEIDSQLVAGVVVNIGSLVLDGSLKYKIKEAASAKQDAS
jgi:F0F1-type ATP synthase delta subunit